MSVKNALQFIARLRADERLRAQLISPDGPAGLERFVELGDRIGLAFTVEELRTAHRDDWGMRYLSFHSGCPPIDFD